MTQKINQILSEVLERIKPSKEEMEEIKEPLDKFIEILEKKIKSLKINVEIFVGGSFAKNTLIKKNYYDLDIFLRFDKKYKDNDLSNLASKILNGMKNVLVVHGSRDYFKIKVREDLYLEIIPVKKVKNTKESENITDLSYSHVKYIKKKIKSEKVLDDIKIAKAFCYANQCYGAESYISGFSGYGLELLVYHYGNFLKFIRAISKDNDKKIVIDIEKFYRNKNVVLMDINSSKLQSPIVLIDPTYKQRNVLAALSDETFERFKESCKKFLKTPSIKSFEIEKTDLEGIKKNAIKNKFEFILLEAKTDRQEGDIAGSKLMKFYRHLNCEIEKFFEVKDKGFNYNEKKAARFFFVVKKKKDILISGPSVKDLKNVKRFEKRHGQTFVKSGKVYSQKKVSFGVKEFIGKWKSKNKKKIKEMGITGLEVV